MFEAIMTGTKICGPVGLGRCVCFWSTWYWIGKLNFWQFLCKQYGPLTHFVEYYSEDLMTQLEFSQNPKLSQWVVFVACHSLTQRHGCWRLIVLCSWLPLTVHVLIQILICFQYLSISDKIMPYAPFSFKLLLFSTDRPRTRNITRIKVFLCTTM